MSKANNEQAKKLVRTKVRPDKSIEVEIQKHPKDTVLGKVLLFLIIIVMVGLPLVGLIYTLIQVIQ